MTHKVKTRPDPDAGKTIGELVNEARKLIRIKEYLGGDKNYGGV